MGSPLTVALAEIRVTETEQLALETSSQPPKHYRHFVDDGFGHFMDKQHANEFLRHINGLTNDLQYTIEQPTPYGSIHYLDVLIHADKTTSAYRKPTYTNLYIHYSSSTPQSSKDSVISSLTRRAHTICFPSHIEPEIQHIKPHHGPNPEEPQEEEEPSQVEDLSLCQYTPSLSCWLPQRHQVHTPTLRHLYKILFLHHPDVPPKHQQSSYS